MKKLLLILIAGISLAACNMNDKKGPGQQMTQAEKDSAVNDTTNYTTIQWLDSLHRDMGTVKEGAQVEVSFRFKNTGAKNLVISEVTASCGCTVPDKPGEPIAPGKEGLIKAVFDSKNHKGTNNKSLSVFSNTKPKPQSLTFTVEVTD